MQASTPTASPISTSRYATIRRFFSWTTLLLLLPTLLLTGCDEDPSASQPAKIVFDGDAVRWGALESSVPLRVYVEGKKQAGLLGGSGSASGVSGTTVRFQLDAESIAQGATLEPANITTDAGGMARTTLRVGNHFGVHTITATVNAADPTSSLSTSIKLLAGISLEGDGQDISASSRSERDLCIRVEKSVGEVFPGVLCDVFLQNAPKGSSIRSIQKETDSTGVANISIHGGSATGPGAVGIRLVAPPGSNAPHDLPILKSEFFVINGWGLFFIVGGGLAIFLLGMRLMSEGLRLVAGDKMRSVLELFTRNRITGLVVGCVVTGVIQSSSACSVMVVGFVNAGLMKLAQAISVIMGANIGTTVTAQLISFKLEELAAPAIILGMLGMLIAKKQTSRYAFQILVGFGLLFFGLTEMSSALKALKNSQMVQEFFAGVSAAPVNGVIPIGSVFRGILVGLLVTITIQSSSASIGMLIALLQAGLLDAWTAFPILLGDNIGTTITAVLAAIGSNKIAKQTACAHFLFNVFGSLLMLVLLYIPWDGVPVFMQLVDHLTSGNCLAGENAARFIANAHSLFNVSIALILLPFVPLLAKICRKIIPDNADALDVAIPVQTLEPHLLSTPSLAIAQIIRRLIHMIEDGRTSLSISYEAMKSGDRKKIEEASHEVAKNEERIDRHQDEATSYLQRISQEPLTEDQSMQLPRLLHAINDAERIGDHADGLIRMIRQAEKRGISFDEKRMTDITTMYQATDEMIQALSRNLINMDAPKLATIRACEERIDAIRKKVRKAQLDKPMDQCTDCRGDVFFLEFMTHHERVGDHLMNIAKACMPPEVEIA